MKASLKRVACRIAVALSGDESNDIARARTRLATWETATYVEERMPSVPSVADPFAVHDMAVERATIEGGLVLEFGVFRGRSINYIASKRPWQVDGFDSFEGLPEFWRDGFAVGHFAIDDLPRVAGNVRLHKGWFEQTLPTYLDGLGDRRSPVAYLHIDCDLYSSTRTVLSCLEDNIVPGTVIVFDEYFNYPGWRAGEFKAFQEFVARHSMSYEYITYNRCHEQVAVRVT